MKVRKKLAAIADECWKKKQLGSANSSVPNINLYVSSNGWINSQFWFFKILSYRLLHWGH